MEIEEEGKMSVRQAVQAMNSEERSSLRQSIHQECGQRAIRAGMGASVTAGAGAYLWCRSKYFPYVRRYYPVAIAGAMIFSGWSVTKIYNRYLLSRNMRKYGPWIMIPDNSNREEFMKRAAASVTNAPTPTPTRGGLQNPRDAMGEDDLMVDKAPTTSR